MFLMEPNIAVKACSVNTLSGYGRLQMGGVAETHTIALSLDRLSEELPPPNLIKCDVEGVEVEGFSGQIKMLGRIRPIVICEVGKEASGEITAILTRERYRLYDGEKPLSPQSEVDHATWNTIAMPEELCQRYPVGTSGS